MEGQSSDVGATIGFTRHGLGYQLGRWPGPSIGVIIFCGHDDGKTLASHMPTPPRGTFDHI